jgi:AMP-polyphosphate phosphotransferase
LPARPKTRKPHKTAVEELRAQLVQAQVEHRGSDFPVIIMIAGFDAAGKGEVIHVLNEWFDPRRLETIAFNTPSDEERERPPFWRYWRHLPPRGDIGIFMSAWNTVALAEEAFGKSHPKRFARAISHIANFEKMLVDDGALIVKVWLYLSRKAQRKRLLRLEKDPKTRWRVSPEDWKHNAAHERLDELSRELMKATDRPGARWTVIDSGHPRTRDLGVGRAILEQLRRHIAQRAKARKPAVSSSPAPPVPLVAAGRRLLDRVDLSRKLTATTYKRRLHDDLGELNRLAWDAERAARSIVFVFEGWDAAGKGGAIRRLISAVDPRFHRVASIAKPTDEEKAHHYLWRFWRHLPRDGMMTVFDRSWYGRVLVERIEGFCTEAEWRRAFDEINEFERQLTEHGTILVKFWLHISKAEQLKRFKAREGAAHKRHKINTEDWRNRDKWDAYEICLGDMFSLTDTPCARWHLISANDKRHARAEVLRTACREIEAALDA